MKRVLVTLTALSLALMLVLAGCGKGGKDNDKKDGKEKVKVGFLYIGPIGDGGWTYAHNEGRKMLEKKTGVETIYKENVAEAPGCMKVMEDMISQGCNVIFATSFGYMDYMLQVAKKYPKVKFLHCSGYKKATNMGNYFGRIYQARYLSGIVAGMKTKKNSIGYVAAFEIPEVIRGINAFALGVQSVNPKAKVKVKWTHTWYDPAKEKEAAKALLDEGVDVVAQHQDTAGPQQAAEERGVWSIGYNTDMYSKAPKAYMTAPVWNWGPFYVDQVKQIKAGDWKAEAYWGGLKDGIVKLAPLTKNAPEGAKAKVEAARKKIIAGELKVFSGELKDQSGKVRVEKGKTMSDKEMLNMKWFVEGVVGKSGEKK